MTHIQPQADFPSEVPSQQIWWSYMINFSSYHGDETWTDGRTDRQTDDNMTTIPFQWLRKDWDHTSQLYCEPKLKHDGHWRVPFSLHFDETTTSQVKKKMDLTVRYWSPTHNEVWVSYYTSLMLSHAQGTMVTYKMMAQLGQMWTGLPSINNKSINQNIPSFLDLLI